MFFFLTLREPTEKNRTLINAHIRTHTYRYDLCSELDTKYMINKLF